jgi:hypothetical protein
LPFKQSFVVVFGAFRKIDGTLLPDVAGNSIPLHTRSIVSLVWRKLYDTNEIPKHTTDYPQDLTDLANLE